VRRAVLGRLNDETDETGGRNGNVMVGLTRSLDAFIAGPNDGPGNPLGDGGGRLFDWWSAGTERIGPRRPLQATRAQPPRGRGNVRVRGDHHRKAHLRHRQRLGWPQPMGAPFFLLTHNPPDPHVGPGKPRSHPPRRRHPPFANLKERQFDLECTRVVESDGVNYSATASRDSERPAPSLTERKKLVRVGDTHGWT